MKIINLKTIVLNLFLLACLIACTDNEEYSQNQSQKFNLEFYKANKSSINNFLKSPQLQNVIFTAKSSNKELVAHTILDEINQEFDASLQLNEMDLAALDEIDLGSNWKQFYVDNGYIDIEKANLIEQFGNDAATYSFEVAIENFQGSVLNMKLSNRKFAEYNLLVNSLYLMNDAIQTEGNFNKSSLYAKDAPSWWGTAGCGVAIAANAVSTYALVACAVPNPATPAACTTAIVAKALSFAGVIFGCSYLKKK